MNNTTPRFLKLLALSFFFSLKTLSAQSNLDGYVFEENNRGYLNQVKITLFQMPENALRGEIYSDSDGHFSTQLAPGEYRAVFEKDLFFQQEKAFTVAAEKVFLKIELKRKPGYLLDATIAEARTEPDQEVDAIQFSDIEIYNRTTKSPEIVLKRHKDAFFQFTFEQGNHYTVMVRKVGYLAKRIEVYVNVEGCILCVHGVSNLRPGLTDNLTAGNTMGTLLCNIELEKAKLDKRIALKNIYYDYDKWDIRRDAAKELENAVNILVDNPGISLELGSHTDSRGSDAYNLNLSQKRAESAVAYIIEQGIENQRITAKGYGETTLVNRCKNGVTCSEEEHQLNRRTELKIIGISTDSLEYMRWKSLEEIVREEEFRLALNQLTNEQEYKVPETAKPAAELPVRNNLPEANNSVKLPEFQPAPQTQSAENQEDKEQSAIQAAKQNLGLKKLSGGQSGVQELPENFSGFNVEIAKTDIPLEATHSIFQQHSEVFHKIDAEGMHCYFIGNFSNVARARTFYTSVAVPKFPSARLCEFKNGVKSYTK